jgi:hypothetical protein
MTRLLSVLAVLASVGVAAYYLTLGAPPPAPDGDDVAVQDALDAAVDEAQAGVAAAQEAAEAAGAAVEATVGTALDAAQDAVEEAAGALEGRPGPAREDTRSTAVPADGAGVSDAVETVTGARNGAADGGDAASAPLGAPLDGAGEADAAGLETPAVTRAETPAQTRAEIGAEMGADLDALFTVGGFDFDRAVAVLDAAEIRPVTRAAVIASLEAAGDNPDLLAAALGDARRALGLDEEDDG